MYIPSIFRVEEPVMLETSKKQSSCGKSVNFSRTVRRILPGDCNPHLHSCGNLKKKKTP
jgi:hypothetical protein